MVQDLNHKQSRSMKNPIPTTEPRSEKVPRHLSSYEAGAGISRVRFNRITHPNSTRKQSIFSHNTGKNSLQLVELLSFILDVQGLN